jgi:hypothetical protein
MSMDYEDRKPDDPTTSSDSPLFTPNPIWERGNKRRGARRATAAAATPAPTPEVPPEARTFAADEEPMTLDRPITPRPAETAYVVDTGHTPDMEPVADAGLVAPIGRSTTTNAARGRSEGGARSALMIGGALALLLGIGTIGWVASHDRDGIPTLAPGQGNSEFTKAAPLPPVDLPPTARAQAQAQAEPTPTAPPAATAAPAQTARAAEPAARPVQTARAERRTTSARVRPASSAADAAVNTSATLPAGPQPYSTVNPGAAPPAAAPTAPPTEAAPVIPSTPPTAPAEPPASTTPSETATPPTQTSTTPPQA